MSKECEVAGDVERQLQAQRAISPKLAELPITPLRGLADLVHLELALQRFAQIHRSKRSKALIRSIRAILEGARARLREERATSPSGLPALHSAYPRPRLTPAPAARSRA